MTDLVPKPKNTKRGLYRSKNERTAFEAWVAKKVLSGYVKKNLPALYMQEFDRKVTAQTVKTTMEKLENEWRLTAAEDTSFHINMELERLDVMEREAWRHYRSVGGVIQETEVKDLFYYDPNGKGERKGQSMTVIKTKEDPRLAMQWFDKIMKIQTDRRKVLKLETTVNINNIMAVKAYTYFDPSKDWDDHPNMPKANVIDAEFSEGAEA